MSLWSDAYINQLAEEAEHKIALDVNCIVHRFALDTTAGIPVYTIPDYVIGIRRVTWKGTKLTYISQINAQRFFPLSAIIEGQGAFLYSAFNPLAFNTGSLTDAAQRNKPAYYGFSGVDRESIQFYPTPNETIASVTNDLFGSEIGNRVIIECYRLPDVTGTTHRIPVFVRRRLIKSYVLWKAFSKEGDGQNLRAAKYFEQKYLFGIALFKSAHSRIFSAKFNYLKETFPMTDLMTGPARPQLPTNYQTYENLKQ